MRHSNWLGANFLRIKTTSLSIFVETRPTSARPQWVTRPKRLRSIKRRAFGMLRSNGRFGSNATEPLGVWCGSMSAVPAKATKLRTVRANDAMGPLRTFRSIQFLTRQAIATVGSE
jgi:hypothetical protein